jgi:hypothetical protein
MWADLAAVAPPDDDRVRLEQGSSDYEVHDPAYRDQLRLTRLRPARAWYAAAHDRAGRFAGRAWSLHDGELAVIFDMEVWPRRRHHLVASRPGLLTCRRLTWHSSPYRPLGYPPH